ncbi:putative selenate ABC transporter substrate-binding protein [Halomicronema hongdechloris C2206]|uniref:Selenate ABC transporter substrate-binding protein n=1 Tax=Halomicronema hongdechloris C2206 TaxID=1641165 RepID=A0A1Z3HP96_9CYAN|nr:PhnD/SsuA/transferrin family substrate-binding protein [Halomicronema hongdechloris]ASC72119.1 putative selenate ABC transporter substrate-binding protein [Halomicronema hongdechloris C2206]
MPIHPAAVSTAGVISLICLLGLSACGQPSSSERPEAFADPSRDTASDGVTRVPASAPGMVAVQRPVRVGVLAIDSALSMHKRYQPLIDYLAETLDRPVELVALTQDSQFTAVAAGEIDFIATNPLAAVQVQRFYHTEFLVTHSRPRSGSEFSGLIIARADSALQSLEDLRGQRVACVDFETAAAGCLFQIHHLRQAEIDPFKDFGEFIENPSQDSIVLAVLNRTIDAGFIRTGQLEKMVKNGLLPDADGIKILDQARDDFVYPHTTTLYPEWPLAALSDTDPALSDAVGAALLAMPPDHPALAAANLEGFVDAVNYRPIDELIETLQLKSWDAD